MGLFEKLKNVLFEEEEVEIPVLTKTEPVSKPQDETVLKEKIKVQSVEIREKELKRKDEEKENITHLKNVKRDFESTNDMNKEEILVDNNEKEVSNLPKEEKTSPFLSFDEDEFDRINARIHPQERNSKVVNNSIDDYELPKEKPNPPKRFRPSPVISPVYGILDKNYKKEDIVERTDSFDLLNEVENAIDVDSVRRKAYGTLEDDIETTLNSSQSYEDDTPPVLDDRSIAELLNEKIDEKEEVITISNDDTENVVIEDELPTFEEIVDQQTSIDYDNDTPNDILEKTNTLKILDDIEKELSTSKNDDLTLEDTRETDLFNLIDSMYENKEEE